MIKSVRRAAALFLALFTALSMCTVTSLAEPSGELPPLKEAYDFLIGNVFSARDLSGERFELLRRHFDVLTAENDMKPEALGVSPGVFRFDTADVMISAAEDTGIKVHGHTIAWHQQSPLWLYQDAQGNPLTRAEAEENLKEYVAGVAGHFAGKLLSWDVLNEAMNDNPYNPEDWRAWLRQTPWYAAFENGATEGQSGADYIDMLFREARKADPDAILYYNDYNLDNQNKAAAVANMVDELNKAYLAEGNSRLLIDGIGMQGHYSMGTNLEDVEASIKAFAGIGVEVSITELDITVPGVSAETGLTEEAEIKQALKFAELFTIFKKYPDTIARVTFWGLDDGSSWRSTQFPQLFNSDLSAKKAFYAVADPEGFLEEYKEYNVVTMRSGSAAYGTPVLDGEIDDIWLGSEPLPIDQMLQAWPTAQGTAKVLWDNEALYVLFEVEDDKLDNTSTVVHEKDSVEAFVDEENCKKRRYLADDGQYRVCYDGSKSFGESTNGVGFEAVVSVGGAGYVVEMRIPFKEVTPEAGMVIGFDAQVNDGEDGARVGIAKWNDATDNSWQDTTGWGTVKLEEPPPMEETPEIVATPTPESTPKPEEPVAPEAVTLETPNKAMPVILGSLALICAVCLVVIFLRRRSRK